MTSIGFIGLGDIGWPIAERSLLAGHALHVWGRSRDRSQHALDAGAVWADSPRALAETCDIVALCVFDTDAVEQVVFGENGVASAASPRARVLIDHTTADPLRSRDMADRLRAANGMGWVDAPVSGGPVGARAGTLAVMVGGADADVEFARTEMQNIASNITHLGAVGSGQATKLCNQIIISSAMCGIAEALDMASRFGLDTTRLSDAFSGGWADSALLRHYLPRMASGKLQGHTRTLIKDLTLARKTGKGVGAQMMFTERLLADYGRVIDAGHLETGIGGIIHLLAEPPLPGHED